MDSYLDLICQFNDNLDNFDAAYETYMEYDYLVYELPLFTGDGTFEDENGAIWQDLKKYQGALPVRLLKELNTGMQALAVKGIIAGRATKAGT